MAMRAAARAFGVALMVVTLGPAALPQRAPSTYDPARKERLSKPRDSFIDFTLKRINPSDKDYGEELAGDRNLLIADTVESRYFWSNLVALALLGCFFILLAFQQRRLNRTSWKSAEIIAQYEHAIGRANLQVEDAKMRCGELTQALSRLKESALRPQPPPRPDNAPVLLPQERTRPANNQQSAAETAKNGPGKSSKSNSGGTSAKGESGAQIALFKADADLVSNINLLEQQLARSKETEGELRRQVNDLGRKLQTEQETNRSLKGA